MGWNRAPLFSEWDETWLNAVVLTIALKSARSFARTSHLLVFLSWSALLTRQTKSLISGLSHSPKFVKMWHSQGISMNDVLYICCGGHSLLEQLNYHILTLHVITWFNWNTKCSVHITCVGDASGISTQDIGMAFRSQSFIKPITGLRNSLSVTSGSDACLTNKVTNKVDWVHRARSKQFHR